MTAYHELFPEAAIYLTGTFPQYTKFNGPALPITGLAYDAATDEAAFWKIRAIGYTSGDLTVDIDWYADTASTNAVVWGVAIAVITPETDTQDVETKTLATENTVTDTHLGTTGQRLHRAVVTVSNLDSLAANDFVMVRIRRLGSNGSDTMAGDAILVMATLSYAT